ncbi:chemotaxis protein CheB [Mycobacterium sp. MYCO198283]|uniref:chemotaxis protein CheB n=1 Tax=Mycobacterium sp. MYCO198283 TaxID=2883505 RepID=UPI001E3AE660|nr:chemotaxis protein CheB [Mycobacterium sp. MYCO198283]MCG5431029.1 chemotaxis protein CheB [Mycobacterium sp. MYCO198283]
MTSDSEPPLECVAMGASAGGVEALTEVVAGLPDDAPFAVLVVLHMPSGAPSVLARILDRNGPLPASPAVDGEPLRAGHIHVAVPDNHLLVHNRRILLSEGPTENGHRPAINALFRSVALEYGQQSVGVLLSGVLDDGVQGLSAIRSRGGVTVTQRPADAAFPAMPLNALQAGVVDHECSAAELGRLLTKLTAFEREDRRMEPDKVMELENRIAMGKRFAANVDTEVLGAPSGYTCPDCNGSLTSVADSDRNFRCRVGHAWTAEALLQARDAEVESALWIALRSLQEKAKMSRKLARNAGDGPLSRKYQTLAEEAEHASVVLSERLSEAYGMHEQGSVQ